MPLRAGDRIGPYEVTAPLGKGGMGEVYRATDTALGRQVAIKVLPEAFAQDAERLARFEREARALAALNHPNIAGIYGVETTASIRALIMELVEGPTLADRIAEGPMSLEEALPIARQIAEALETAHKQGIIHRDLKPANVKVRQDGTVKVLDFGLAKATEPVGVMSSSQSMSPTITTPAMTQAGMILGTAAYMSPEQAKGKPVDKGADIWAFGVVLYEMLTGKQLHQGDTVPETLAAVLKEAPDLQRVPAKVRRLLRSCLQKDPEQRLHDIADWKLLLDEDTGDAPPHARSRARWLWPSVAALLLVAAAALGLMRLLEAPSVAQEVRSQIPQPEGLTFNEGTQAAISPDGRWLAFPALGPDNVSRMYIRSIDSLEVRPLPGSEGIIDRSPPPFWSYDSRFVVYGALGKLKKSEITGTPAQTIAETGLPFVQGGTWNGDGVILYAKTTSNMEQVASSGGTPVAVTMLAPAERAHRWPQFLPDGRRFLYQRVSNVPEKTGVYVGSLDVKPEDQSLQPLLLTDKQAWWVTSEGSGKTYLLMQREEALLAQSFDIDSATLSGVPIAVATGVGSFPTATAGLWSVARNGALVYRSGGTGLPQLTWVDLTGRTVGTVAEGGLYAGLAVSPEGTRIAYGLTDVQGNTDIWVRDLVSGSTTKLTFDPHPDNRPVWSHDGTKVMFAANRSGRFDLYEKNADGSGEERLLVSSDQNKYPTSASRDGRFLLFASNGPNAQDDLWVLPLDGERKPFVFLNTDAHETQGQFSPDQRWITYHSMTAGIPQVFVRPFSPAARSAAGATGSQWIISADGGSFPQWSANGKRLFYVAMNSDLTAVDVQTGTSFGHGASQRLFGAVPPGVWSLSPRGDRFLLLRTASSAGPPPPITMVLNWMTKLEQ